MGISGLGTGSPGTAAGAVTGLGRGSTRRNPGRARAALGRARATWCPRTGAGDLGCATSARARVAARSHLGRAASAICAFGIALLGRPASSRHATSACGATSASDTAGRRSGTGVESARGPVLGCRSAGGVRPGSPCNRLGRAVGAARAGDSARAFLERAGRSVMGRDQNRGAGRSSRPVVVGASRPATPASSARDARTARTASSLMVGAGRRSAAVVRPRGRDASGDGSPSIAGIHSPARTGPAFARNRSPDRSCGSRGARRRRGATTRDSALGSAGRRRGYHSRAAGPNRRTDPSGRCHHCALGSP